jgi:hypothetical protein
LRSRARRSKAGTVRACAAQPTGAGAGATISFGRARAPARTGHLRRHVGRQRLEVDGLRRLSGDPLNLIELAFLEILSSRAAERGTQLVLDRRRVVARIGSAGT